MEIDTDPCIKSVLTCLILCLSVSPATAQDKNGPRFYGALNQSFLSYDDGLNKLNYGRVDNAVGDNVNRFGMSYDSSLSSGWDLTGTAEFGLAPKPSNQVNQLDSNNSGWNFDENSLRKFELVFARSGIGTFYVGQGDMSGRGSAPDFSGTDVIASSNPAELAGGNFWRSTATGALTTRQLNDSFDNFSSGRRMRLRYDSPEMRGFYLSASVGREILTSGDDSTYVDVTARYEKQWTNIGLAVEVAVKGLGQNEYAGGAGFAVVHLPTGINIAASSLHTTGDPHFGFAKIGLKRDFFSFGATAVSYDMYNGGSFVRYGTESLSEGFSIVQTVDSINMDIYLIVRSYEGYNNIGLPNEDFLTSAATSFGISWTF